MGLNDVKVVVLWREDPRTRGSDALREIRYPAVLEALAAEGFDVRHLAYFEEDTERAKETLLASDVVVVWADPISGDRNRVALDDLLREVAATGILVYTHPDTILKMGTKDVLYETRMLSWSHDTHSYPDFESFVERFPRRLENGSARVLKQQRGNGGIGVWKVEALAMSNPTIGSSDVTVRIQHAAPRDGHTEDVPLSDFLERMRGFFDGSGHLIDQAFASRVSEGMVRVYLVKAEVVGFARQCADQGERGAPAVPSDRVFGIPAAKTMLNAACTEFAALRQSMETEWVPGLMDIVGVSLSQLPLLWDADFLFGPKSPEGHDTYLLCEINVSCVSPFPEAAPVRLARALANQFDVAS